MVDITCMICFTKPEETVFIDLIKDSKNTRKNIGIVMKKSFMSSDTRYTILLVLEGILLSFFLMCILNIELSPPTDKVFAEVFDVNVRVDFERTYNNEGGFPVDWERLYEGKISSEKILPFISEWETEVPSAYRTGNFEQFFNTIKNGLFKVSDRNPLHLYGRYYLAAYDIDNEVILLWESKR